MEIGFEVIIYLALFASAFALLGFVIGEWHGRVPKQRRDARGRFMGKTKYFWTGTNIPKDGPIKPLDLDLSGFFPKNSGQPSGISHISGFAEADNQKK